jgi:cation diffusion facilitator CzcD-associated flavoprotein CzcO
MFDTRGCGAGTGGLCLAQGLRQAGVLVEVYERDDSPGSRWRGLPHPYRPRRARSLHACLPGTPWQAFVATAGPGGDDFSYPISHPSERSTSGH